MSFRREAPKKLHEQELSARSAEKIFTRMDFGEFFFTRNALQRREAPKKILDLFFGDNFLFFGGYYIPRTSLLGILP